MSLARPVDHTSQDADAVSARQRALGFLSQAYGPSEVPGFEQAMSRHASGAFSSGLGMDRQLQSDAASNILNEFINRRGTEMDAEMTVKMAKIQADKEAAAARAQRRSSGGGIGGIIGAVTKVAAPFLGPIGPVVAGLGSAAGGLFG
jgi:hypothetical protein